MLLIDTFLAPSTIHGVGLFTRNDIAAGQQIWTYVPHFDKRFTGQEFDQLPLQARSFMNRYGFRENGFYYLDADHFKYINHSDTPNLRYQKTATDVTGDLFADTVIKAGTELLCNYLDFDDGSCCTDFLRK